MILDRIIARRRQDLEATRRQVSLSAQRRAAEESRRRPLDLAAALCRRRVGLIAEIKRRSPSAGEIRPGLDVAQTVTAYADAGAAAVSVLTEPAFFGGSLDDLAAAREALTGEHERPILRKDFILEDYQVYEARAAGADAVLLIAACLETPLLSDLLSLSGELGLSSLVEVHDRAELERVLPLRPRLVGINNRDLRTFTTHTETTLELAPLMGEGAVVVSESGICEVEDVRRMAEAGVRGVLVGEAILRSPDPAAKARELAQAGL